nr:hypothetical protein [uncultured Desulfobacter sp.]
MVVNEAVSRALIETIMFLEFSDDETINPDASVVQMEQISSILQDMDDNEIKKFIKICSMVANEYKDNPEKSKFISSIGENLGLI